MFTRPLGTRSNILNFVKKDVILLIFLFQLSYIKPVSIPSATYESENKTGLIADTTINGTWDGNWKVLSMVDPAGRVHKIHGRGTLTRWIIDAPLTEEIFDSSINIDEVRTYGDRFSIAWYGARPKNADNWWNIQKSINVCLANNLPCFLPGIETGIYKHSKTIEIKKIVNNAYRFCTLHFFGDASYWANGKGSMLQYTGSGGTAFNMQLNKGSEMDHIGFSGLWRSPGGTDDEYFNLTEANYHDVNGLPDNLTGISIDAYPPINGITKDGSSGNKIHDVSIQGFGMGLAMSQNGITQNNDAESFDHINFVNNIKYGFVNGEGQEKGMVITNVVSWGSIYNVINIGLHGARKAGDYTFDYGNIAGRCIEPFNMSISQWFSTTIDHYYVENIRDIGTFAAAMPLNIYNSTFELNFNISKRRNIITSNSSHVNFNHCTIRYYDGKGGDIWVKGKATFDSLCSFYYGKIVWK